MIAKINILLDCLFYVTQEKVSHWFCYWWFHQKCDTFSWNFSNVIRCYLFDRRMPNLVMVPIRHCIPLFCLWWDYRLKRTFCPILLFNNDLDDHEDTFIADLKMDSFDKRPPKEYCNVFSNRLSTLKFHQFLTHVERNTWHISVWKKNFQIMNLDLWHLEKNLWHCSTENELMISVDLSLYWVMKNDVSACTKRTFHSHIFRLKFFGEKFQEKWFVSKKHFRNPLTNH